MDKKLKIALGLLALIAVMFAVFYYWPQIIFLRGYLTANFQRHPSKGRILGLGTSKILTEYHRQELPLSCEVAALKIALSGDC